jgi:excisionase family DNA binding protein
MNERAWLSVKEAVHYCGLSRATIDREIKRGNIKSKLYTTGNGKHGKKRRLISRASMDEWIESLPDAPSRLN